MTATIISAFPACGKSTYYKKWSRYSDENVWVKHNNGKPVLNNLGEPCGEKILDSDSSLFSWVYDENGNKTDVRNPEFPQNYINHIKEHLPTEEIIFVSSHKVVRDALKAENIPYVLIYPDRTMKKEWLRRFKERGNDEAFIQFQDEHWDEFINDMENETFPKKVVLRDTIDEDFITTTVMSDIIKYEEI